MELAVRPLRTHALLLLNAYTIVLNDAVSMADGTFLVSRYLQITSSSVQAKSAILDGVVSTSGGEHTNGRMTFDKWSIGFEQV